MTKVFDEDDFIFNKPIWFVILNDGERVYQDDDRPGEFPASAWLRLKEYLKDNNKQIKEIYLKFRSNEVPLSFPADAEGFFFSKRLICFGYGTLQVNAYMLGYTIGESVEIFTYQVPEMILIEQESRHVEQCKNNIIWKEPRTGCRYLVVENSG